MDRGVTGGTPTQRAFDVIGIADRHELVWRALLRHPAASPAALATDTDLTPAQVVAALDVDLVAIGSDQSMARTLGVGVRTVRREVSELKIRLGVSSRAEIAVAPSRREGL